MRVLLKCLTGMCLSLAALAIQAAEPSVYVYLEAGNSEGGRQGLGYSIDVSRTLSEPEEMSKGTQLKFSDVGTAVVVNAAAGLFKKLQAAARTRTAGPVAMARASVNDTVVASAPGVAWGEPIVYTARMTVSASTLQQPGGETSASAFFDARIGLGGRLASPMAMSGNGRATQTLTIKYRAYAGEEMGLFASMLAQGIAPLPADSGTEVRAAARLDRPARVVLSANKPGANITGASGYIYE
jgi:hypothetical protein